MAQKKSTNKSKKTTLRKCSICRTPGHTKRNCTELASKKILTKKPSFIFVNAHTSVPTSEHVVDLKKDQSSEWEQVTAYKEDEVEARPSTIEFADLVRAANLKKQSSHPNISAFREAITKVHFRHTKPEPLKPVATKKKTPKAVVFGRSFKYKLEDAASSAVQSIKSTVSKFSISPRMATYALSAIFVFAILPFPARTFYNQVSHDTSFIVERSTNAFASLQSSTVAALSNNIHQAESDLNEALKAFSDAQKVIDEEYKALTYVASALPVFGKKIEGRQDVLVAGHHIALGNTYLVKGIDDATKNPDMKNTERLSILKSHIRSSLPQYKSALENIAALDPTSLPVEYQSSFTDFRVLYTAFIDDLQDLVDVIDGLETVLGTDDFRRYLVMFQNNHELRATGGFTGSYALLDVQKGKILNIDIPGGGTYDVQGQLDVYVRPPLPLQLANKRWEFQDVNWFVDYPATARKTAEFYQHARGTTVDGVISINASVLERLLDVLGPMYNSDYEILLDTDNALANLQKEVEVDYDKVQNEPKAVLSSVMTQMVESIEQVEPKQLLGLLIATHNSLQEKEIQVYFDDVAAQKQFRSFGWTGEVQPTHKSQDYLMVVNTNIGGQKSDARVRQKIEHQAVVQDDGSIINTVIIEREHTGKEDEEFYGNQNINYVRVYVPDGSKLLDAGGFSFPEEESFTVPEYWYEDDPELAAITRTEAIDVHTGTRMTRQFGKTTFGNWVVTEPGSKSRIFFTYKLPFTISDLGTHAEPVSNALASVLDKFTDSTTQTTARYTLIGQKQSGSYGTIESSVIFPDAWRPVWRTDDNIHVTANGAQFQTELQTDIAYGVVMQKEK